MILNNVVLFTFLVVITHSQTTNPEVTYGCIGSSSNVVDGNYTKYIDWESHSIWIKKVKSGAVYVIYFNNALGVNMYKAFGLYRCDTEDIYTNEVDQMSVKNPDGIMGCEGTPILFCPTLNEADSETLIDGMSAADGKLDWLDKNMTDFYNCTHWFVYNEETNYPSTATLSFDENIWCKSDINDNNTPDNVIPGGKYDPISDTQQTNRMSDTALTILWSILGVFILLCIAAIIYFIVKWKQKKMLKESNNDSTVGLTQEKEEDKFDTKQLQQNQMSTPLVDEDDISV